MSFNSSNPSCSRSSSGGDYGAPPPSTFASEQRSLRQEQLKAGEALFGRQHSQQYHPGLIYRVYDNKKYLDDSKSHIPPYLLPSLSATTTTTSNVTRSDNNNTPIMSTTANNPTAATATAIQDISLKNTGTTNDKYEADAAAGGGTGTAGINPVLQRVSSLNLISRVASNPALLNFASSTSNLADDTDGRYCTNNVTRNVSFLDKDKHGLDNGTIQPNWRLRDRMKTVGVGLIMALNIGTDPPDIIKPHPHAKLQCWMDPYSMSRAKAREKIGERLEAQYARWQQQRSARPLKYRRALDPTVEDVRALCLWLRRQARHERILLHYNGHGVPRPTSDGEIWVFDKNHSEYLPLSVTDLRQWAGTPTICIIDCSSAGTLIPFLTSPATETPTGTPTRLSPSHGPTEVIPPDGSNFGPNPQPRATTTDPTIVDMDTAAAHWVKDTIVLCPTSDQEYLPMHPDYPADIFTSCLTTPIQMALRWFVRNNPISMGNVNPESVDNIPGHANDRKTPLGELNWIFTAITDSIAWNVLPKPLFQRLFRQDLLVACMFRNFLLADRILRSLNVTPQSYPPLPAGVADHPLWYAWDLACETCLFGLIQDGILVNHTMSRTIPRNINNSGTMGTEHHHNQQTDYLNRQNTNKDLAAKTSQASAISSPFFSEQLTAFEVWLEYAAIHKKNPHLLESPEQLPIVLQVLLLQVHRVPALELLRRFLELGPWAVNLSLSLGIFPYVLKLLQSADYRSVLLNIWASILKFDPSCQVDLVKHSTPVNAPGHALGHFIQPLANWATATHQHPPITVPEAAKQRILASYCLAATCHKYPIAQSECLRQNLLGSCTKLLSAQIKLQEQQMQQAAQEPSNRRTSNDASRFELLSSTAREWICLCLGNLVQACPPAQTEAYDINAHLCLMSLQQNDELPNVRAAASYALGCLFEYIPHSLTSSSSSTSLPVDTARGMQSLGSPLMVPGNAPTFGSPGPMSLGPQAIVGAIPSASQSFQPRGIAFNHQQGGMAEQTGALPGNASASHLIMAGPGTKSMQQSQPQHMWPGGVSQAVGPQGLVPVPVLSTQQVLSSMTSQHPGRINQGIHMGIGQAAGVGSQGAFLNPQGMSIPISTHGRPAGYSGPMIVPGNMVLSQGQQPPLPSVSKMESPVGNSATRMDSSGLGYPDLQLQNMQQSGRRPTVFEDRRRIEFDSKVVESVLMASSDGCAMVRYESVVALSNFVEKYLQAFLVVAEDASRLKVGELKVAEGAEAQEDSDFKRKKLPQEERLRVVPLPRGVNQFVMERFEKCWKALRVIQHDDPHPNVAEASNTIVRVVHETLLDLRMEKEAKKAKEEKNSGLSEIREDGEIGEGIGRPVSDIHLDIASPDSKGNTNRAMPHSDGPTGRLPSVKLRLLKRSTSETAAGNFPSSESPETSREPAAPLPLRNPITRIRAEKLLPKSQYYRWRKSIFKSNYDDVEGEEWEERDPMNPVGAARNYQNRRNASVREESRRLADRFVGLRPRIKNPRKSFDVLLEDEEDTDARDDSLKSDLRLREKILLRNTPGVRMTSMLKFHPYEDALIVCDNEDSISVWDYEKGDRKLSFRNGNSDGSRMTTTRWINESSSSLFLVGSDDGSARIWKGIVKDNGEISKQHPTLVSAFFAVPDMKAGQRSSSGLICEWQQTTGTLIAGGKSSILRCWDLAAEKSFNDIEIETDACVTSLATAWDEDTPTIPGNRGMGPNIVVAGHSDGTLKIFDIRKPKSASTTENRSKEARRKPMNDTFSEHGSWIVDTSFTSYGGRSEIITGSLLGDIRAWDLRMPSSLRVIEAQRTPMTALSVHKSIPIAATGSHAQFIKIMTLEGEALQVARFHEELAGHRIGPVSCLEFHKHKYVLAAGFTDSLVSIFKPRHPIKW